ARRRDPLGGRTILPASPKKLNSQQHAALDIVLAEDRAPVLLFGVTGSGKTEVYLQAIAEELARGRGAIVLVPEISLTPQTVRRFASRFGDKVAVLHSALSDGERFDEWHRIRKGEARVVVGPRSAVFAPVADLGLIVVDEEHDSSYKQEETPRYNARDVAVMRGVVEKCKVVLGSATPSLESWNNVRRGKYRIARMPSRVEGRAMPAVHLVDMEEEKAKSGKAGIFSQALLDAISSRLARHEQTILFLNRRGYARVWRCDACGWIASCPNCAGAEGRLPFTYHLREQCLRCHVCGAWQHLPNECPECKARDFSRTGIGTERAEAMLEKCFPRARILRMDRDSTSRKNSHDDLLTLFRTGQADILLGTQMIAKGLDFPNVTLVGVLNADQSLAIPDFRAEERTYQLLAQVAGRAGRAEKPGEVIFQTHDVEARAIRLAAREGSFEIFADEELEMRATGFYPPHCHFSILHVKGADGGKVAEWCGFYAKSLKTYSTALQGERFEVADAAPAFLEQTEGFWWWQVAMRAVKPSTIASAVRWILTSRPPPAGIQTILDIDALTMM
ncbi:MAG: primosomal protein N', partial [Kiritimatiellae bacterium]|nr:primosomal protein N' [Kiritimatiellia bacterium]